MRIVITGGHHTCALVVAKRFLKDNHQVFWIGHKYSMINDKNPSAEYLEVTSQKIPFFDIKAGKFQIKYKFLHNLQRIPIGVFQAIGLLRRIKPDLVISFGGFIAVPVALGSFLLGICLVTHEQTTVSGLANLFISKIAKKVFVSFEISKKYFPAKKTHFTGLPVRQELFSKNRIKFNDCNFKENLPTIYITGGKQGSHLINEAVFEILPDLLEKFNIIHQTGSTTIYSDISKALSIKKSLGKNAQRYLPKEYFFENEIGGVINRADFLISRAGAHTIYELIILGKPAILIPLPWSNQNEQVKNAQLFCDLGLGIILSQKKLKGGELKSTVIYFSENAENFHLKKQFSFPEKKPEDIIYEESIKIVKGK